MESLRVKDLREIAKSKGLKGWYKLRKSELISFIKKSESSQIEQRRQERLEKVTAEAKVKAEKKAKSKTRRQTKRDEAKLEAERRAEVKRVESDQRIMVDRPETKETKSQRKKRKQLERQAKQAETQRADHERAHKKKNPKKARKEEKRRHRATKKEARRQTNAPALTEPTLRSTAINGKTKKWFVSGEGYKDPRVFLSTAKPSVQKVVDSEKGSKKVHLNLVCTLVKENMVSKQVDTDTFGARSKTHTLTIQLGDIYDEMTEKMLESLAMFQKNGSGWRLKTIEGLEISLTKFEPLKGARHSALPPFVAKKKAVINMKNKDDQCFKWAATRALHPVEDHAHRVTELLKKQSEEYN